MLFSFLSGSSASGSPAACFKKIIQRNGFKKRTACFKNSKKKADKVFEEKKRKEKKTRFLKKRRQGFGFVYLFQEKKGLFQEQEEDQVLFNN